MQDVDKFSSTSSNMSVCDQTVSPSKLEEKLAESFRQRKQTEDNFNKLQLFNK